MGSESKKTVSRCTTEAAQGTHAFEIVGYSLKRGMGSGNFIRSGTFTVGGHDWAIRFYPDGEVNDLGGEYMSFYLELMDEDAQVRAFYDLGLLDQVTGSPKRVLSESIPRVFSSCDQSRFGPEYTALIVRNTLEVEPSKYIVDDRLTIECKVTVVKESHMSKTVGSFKITVPPSDLPEHFSKLLLDEETMDVTFIVREEAFHAHKLVLAARSPVFKAELYGQMKERTARHVTVEDVQPDVFRALLHFIYNDSLPLLDWCDLSVDEYCETIRHLLVAADRYAMDRLKVMCASMLVEYLNVETVATTLALADQHNCDTLKDVCIEFMVSSGDMDAVVATQGYANLKRACPSVLVDVLEKTSKSHKRKLASN
ncbi:hypothetical protein ACP70R_003109 [Stipagrostis hirtigluma subsp. patula]